MRVLAFMTAFLSIFGRLLCSEPGKSTYKTSNVYDELRTQILELKATHFDVPTNKAVLAVVMETGYAKAVATLLAVIDGTTSLYFSNGGGIIGAGENPGPSAAARELVAKSAYFLSACTPTKKFPLPRETYTRFYIITPKGVLTSEVKADDLGNDRHLMSPLFHTAHKLIAQIQLREKNRNVESVSSENAYPPRLWINHSTPKTSRQECEERRAVEKISHAK